MKEVQAALNLFVSYLDGDLLETELISRLAGLPQPVLEALPDGPTKERVLHLKKNLSGTVVLFCGITREEVEQRAAGGSPAAQAILSAVDPTDSES